jgi:hypothetical protein
MAFTNILGRTLGRDVLNFGYSGQGYMETSVAAFLVKVQDAGARPAAAPVAHMQRQRAPLGPSPGAPRDAKALTRCCCCCGLPHRQARS